MTTYTISLDDVDLALLPLHTSYNNFLRKEHFEFEVKKTVLFEVPEPSTLYTCHICAIVMPAVFAREHTTSVKHRANARIASVAAQRLCAHVSALPPPSAPSTALTARFCVNCAIVAGDDHYRTREHRDAVAHDNRLWDLMKAYAQESEDDDPKYDQFCCSKQRSPNNGMDKNNDHKDDLEFKNDGNSTNSKAMAAQAIDTYQPTESIDREEEHKPIEENIAKNCEINNNLKEYNDDHKTDDINDNISTSNSTEANVIEVKVKSDTLIEYPYEVTATGHTYCVICKCKVPGSAHNREEHVKGSRHRKMVISQSQPTQPIKNEEEEQTEENNGIDDNLEEYSKDEEFSDDNNSLGTNLYEASDEDVIGESQIQYPFEVTATGVDCVVCDCEVPNNERSRNEHVQGRTHRNMMNRANESIYEEEEQIAEDCETNDSFEEYREDEEFDNNDNNNMISNIQYPFKVTATGVVCVICDCNVPNHKHNRIEHIQGWRHRNMIEHPLKVTVTGLRCIVCDCKVPHHEQSRNEHIQGRRHRNMMSRANGSIDEEEHIAEYSDNFEEYSEDEEFDNNYQESRSSVTAHSQIEYPFEVNTTGRVECVVCDCKVLGNAHIREQHIYGMRHRQMVSNLPEEGEQSPENSEIYEGSTGYSEDEEFIDYNSDF